MEPTGFKEENGYLNPPEGISPEDCSVLSVWRGKLKNNIPVIISCWKLTKEELEEINKTGRIYIMVWGTTMPPIIPFGTNPFEEGKEDV